MTEFAFLSQHVNSLPKTIQKEYILKSGKTGSQIRSFELRANIEVPEELKQFYEFSYGAKLREYEILTIAEIAKLLPELRKIYADFWTRGSVVPFAYVAGVGDYVAFDIEQASADGLLILDCFHEFPPAQWKGICFGLKTWLTKMAENGFQPFWLKERHDKS